MAKSWHYPRWRRIGMQVGMWIILGATMGLAALVNYEVRQAARVVLAGEEQFDGIVVKLPRGWGVSKGSAGEPSIVVQATEPGESARELIIRYHRVESLISPEEYLVRDPIFGSAIDGTYPLRISPVADRPGITASAQLEWRGSNGVREPHKLVRVCTILPSRHALVVELIGPGVLSEADVSLAEQIAAAMQVTGEAWPEEGVDSIELPSGAVAGVPSGFLPVVEHDPNRISRSMLLSDEAGQWVSIELIPCVFFPSDTADALRTMLLPHGLLWQMANVKIESPGVWRIDPQTRPKFPRRAYLMARDNGHAVLAVFRTRIDSENLISPAWSQMRATIKLPAAADFSAQIALGVEEVDRMRLLGLSSLIPTREEQWWLWYQNTAETYLGHTRTTFDARDTWSAKTQSEWRLPNGAMASLMHDFASDNSMKIYRSVIQRIDDEDRPGRSYVRVLDREMTAERGTIRITLKHDRPLPPWTQEQPDGFVPGGWLGMMLGSLSSQAVILRTDSLTGCETVAPLNPMTVLVRPCVPGELPPEDRTKWPICLSVQVNGSSELMRWHFSNDDQLQQIDFAGGVHRIRSDEQNVTTFSRDASLLPALEQ